MTTLTAYGYACCEWPGLKPIGIGRTPLDAVNDAPDGACTDNMPTLPITETLYRAIQDGQMPAAATVLYDHPDYPLGFLCTIEEAAALDADDADDAEPVPPMTCESCFFACTAPRDGAALSAGLARCRRFPPSVDMNAAAQDPYPIVLLTDWCGEWREVPKG